VQKEQHRTRAITAADSNPLLDAAKPHRLKRINSRRDCDRARRTDLMLTNRPPTKQRAHGNEQESNSAGEGALEHASGQMGRIVGFDCALFATELVENQIDLGVVAAVFALVVQAPVVGDIRNVECLAAFR